MKSRLLPLCVAVALWLGPVRAGELKVAVTQIVVPGIAPDGTRQMFLLEVKER